MSPDVISSLKIIGGILAVVILTPLVCMALMWWNQLCFKWLDKLINKEYGP